MSRYPFRRHHVRVAGPTNEHVIDPGVHPKMLTLLIPAFSRLELASSRDRADRGASLVEYALLLTLIALACFAALKFFGASLSSRYTGAASSLA